MTLKLQIISLLVSFIFGIFFSFLLNINYKIIYNEKKIKKIIGTFLFVIFNSLFYFYILLKINNGIVHIYCIFSIILGYILENFVIDKKIKKIAYKLKR